MNEGVFRTSVCAWNRKTNQNHSAAKKKWPYSTYTATFTGNPSLSNIYTNAAMTLWSSLAYNSCELFPLSWFFKTRMTLWNSDLDKKEINELSSKGKKLEVSQPMILSMTSYESQDPMGSLFYSTFLQNIPIMMSVFNRVRDTSQQRNIQIFTTVISQLHVAIFHCSGA